MVTTMTSNGSMASQEANAPTTNWNPVPLVGTMMLTSLAARFEGEAGRATGFKRCEAASMNLSKVLCHALPVSDMKA